MVNIKNRQACCREKIKELRNNNEWTQEELAEMSGVSGNTISRIERGAENIGFESLLLIADALGVSLDELVYGSSREGTVDRMLALLPPAQRAEIEESYCQIIRAIRG